MKYATRACGPRLEALANHSGYRIRLSTLAAPGLDAYPVTVCVRGSESEDEVHVPAPRRHHDSAQHALDYGWECAVLWIDALEHRRS